jgi:hypothetical protein
MPAFKAHAALAKQFIIIRNTIGPYDYRKSGVGFLGMT